MCFRIKRVNKKLNRILFEKINTQTRYNESRIGEESSTEKIKQSKEFSINDYFPLKDTNAVEEFEKLLNNKTFTVPEVVNFIKSNFIFRVRSISYISN